MNFLNHTIILNYIKGLDLFYFTALHRDWLIKQKIRDKNGQLYSKYSVTQIEKYVNTLPAYLADRAYDMQGSRGINAKKRSKDFNAPERRQSESTKPKRKYTRRSQSLLETQQLQQHLPHLQESNTQQPFSLQQSLLQQQLPQESNTQQPLPPQQSLLQQQPLQESNIQQPLLPQQSLLQQPQQSSYQEPPSQQQLLQSSSQQHQPLDYSLDFIPTSGAVAMTFENVKYVFLNLITIL